MEGQLLNQMKQIADFRDVWKMKGLYSTQPPKKKLLFNKNQKTLWSLQEELRQSGNFSSNPVLDAQAVFLTSQSWGSSFVKIRIKLPISQRCSKD